MEISYDYYSDSKKYGWGANIDTICTTVLSNDPNRPDIYCNFITDSVGASLRGAFANLYSTLRGTGEMKGLNYFQFTDKDYDEETNNLGYMYDYMTTLTLSKFKMYILASDYCIDMVRSFLVVPVNVKMLNSIVGSIEEDRNGDGVINLDDFYEMVKNREWTYTKLAEYCDKIYQNAEGRSALPFRPGRVFPPAVWCTPPRWS